MNTVETVKRVFRVVCNLTRALVSKGMHALELAFEAVYRYNYFIGMRVLRMWHRVRRRVRVMVAPLTRRLSAMWRLQVVRRFRRTKRAWRHFLAGFPIAGKELTSAGKRGFRATVSCLWDLTGQAAWRHRRQLKRIALTVAPVAALAALAVTVSIWVKTEFCLELTYRGETIGYIDNAMVYTRAAEMAKDRVINVDNSFSVEAAPQMMIVFRRDQEVLDETQVCEAILRTSGDSIVEASGLYVDDEFIGAMESTTEMQEIFDTIKDGYYDKNNPDERAEFIQDVKVVDGLYPAASVMEKQGMMDILTAEAVVKKTYTVQRGDTFSVIAVRYDMTSAELRAMNPDITNTNRLQIGDELVVQMPQPMLQVKKVETLRYSETIKHSTVYTNNPNKPLTYSVVKTKGSNGSKDVVKENVYINGVLAESTIVSETVTRQPVTQVVERGTQRGNGIATGQMSWPVPSCSNMSRGWKPGHYALDIANGPVTVNWKPCIAADGGTVVAAGWNAAGGGYGYSVIIQHANGLKTLYAHLNRVDVRTGQKVSRNEQVGLIGSTGNSSGPHLHFEVLRNGVRVNPLNYVTPGKIYY